MQSIHGGGHSCDVCRKPTSRRQRHRPQLRRPRAQFPHQRLRPPPPHNEDEGCRSFLVLVELSCASVASALLSSSGIFNVNRFESESASQVLAPISETLLEMHCDCRPPGTLEAVLPTPSDCPLQAPPRRARGLQSGGSPHPQHSGATFSYPPLSMLGFPSSSHKFPSCTGGDLIPWVPQCRPRSWSTPIRCPVLETAFCRLCSYLKPAWPRH